MLRLGGGTGRIGTGIAGGGLLWLFGLEYFAAEAIALHAATGYSMTSDTISKLGTAGCGAAFCSPLHKAMNAGILLSGISVAGGAALSRPAWPTGRSVRAGLVLLGIGGIGTAMVGLWPLDSNLALHFVGAGLTLGLGNIGMALMGAGLARARPVLGATGLAGGLLAVSAFALFAAKVDLGVGAGTMERIAAYPKTIWLALAGMALLAGALRGTDKSETGR